MILSFMLLVVVWLIFAKRKYILGVLVRMSEPQDVRFERIWQENVSQLKEIKLELDRGPVAARKQVLLMDQEQKFLAMQEALAKLLISNRPIALPYLDKLTEVERML